MYKVSTVKSYEDDEPCERCNAMISIEDGAGIVNHHYYEKINAAQEKYSDDIESLTTGSTLDEMKKKALAELHYLETNYEKCPACQIGQNHFNQLLKDQSNFLTYYGEDPLSLQIKTHFP